MSELQTILSKKLTITSDRQGLYVLQRDSIKFCELSDDQRKEQALIIGLVISDLADYFTNELTGKQVGKFARTVIEINPYTNIGQVVLAFSLGMSGCYGTVYPQLTYGLLAGFINQHLVEQNNFNFNG